MDYKLAKQLKELGFPGMKLFWYIPTLEELIEATKQRGRSLSIDECQEIISELTDKKTNRLLKDKSGRFVRGVIRPYRWEAKIEDWGREYGGRHCSEAGDEVVAWTSGKTPEEAVAKLFIKLNKK